MAVSRPVTREFGLLHACYCTAFAVVAENINFGSSKGTNKQVDEGGEAPPAGYQPSEPAPEHSESDDFAVIDDSDDLPF